MIDNYKYYLKESYDFDGATWFSIGLAVWAIGGFLGFLYESIFYYANSGFQVFFWRSSTFGPWLDVYCVASLLIFVCMYRLRRQPWFVVLIAGVGCTLIKLVTGLILYNTAGIRLWNYKLEIMNTWNLGGFICLRTFVEFAVLSLLILYVIVPLIFHMACLVRRNVFVRIWVIIGLICVLDVLYNDVACTFVPQLISAESIYKGIGLKFLTY